MSIICQTAFIGVSVPIGGLFNLTCNLNYRLDKWKSEVSVPIGGLFNLTALSILKRLNSYFESFPSPLGDYLI